MRHSIRELSQKAIDFLCYKKIIQCIVIEFYLRTLPILLHYYAIGKENQYNSNVFFYKLFSIFFPSSVQNDSLYIIMRNLEEKYLIMKFVHLFNQL